MNQLNHSRGPAETGRDAGPGEPARSPDVFGAVSNPVQRLILDELCHGPRAAGELLHLSRLHPRNVNPSHRCRHRIQRRTDDHLPQPAVTSLLLFAGNLSDRIGAKKALGLGVVLFVLASAVCALAPALGVLIAARFAQGGAAAIMLPASMALIREAYPDARRRAKAIGIWAVGGAAAGAVGPLPGGLLTTLDWRLVFAVNVPVCIGMLVLLRYVLSWPKRPAVFDWAGQALAVTALAALTFGLIEGAPRGSARRRSSSRPGSPPPERLVSW